MAPRIVYAGAAAGIVALLAVVAVFLLPIPPALAVLLYVVFGGVFVVSAAIFGRILVME
jgi:drug/metabolite transporter superfamily protein YnfA